MMPSSTKSSMDEEDAGHPPEVEMTVATSTNTAAPVGTDDTGVPSFTTKPGLAAASAAVSRNAMHRFFYPKNAAANDYALGASSTPAAAKAARNSAMSSDDDDDTVLRRRPTTTAAASTGVGVATVRQASSRGSPSSTRGGGGGGSGSRRGGSSFASKQNNNNNDIAFVHNFWTTYDDILILSIFTQVGIVARLASSTWFTIFDGVFNAGALFTNLPLNCLSCFVLGLLCSGERLMEIIATRVVSSSQQQQQQHLSAQEGALLYDHRYDDNDDDYDEELELDDASPKNRNGSRRRLHHTGSGRSGRSFDFDNNNKNNNDSNDDVFGDDSDDGIQKVGSVGEAASNSTSPNGLTQRSSFRRRRRRLAQRRRRKRHHDDFSRLSSHRGGGPRNGWQPDPERLYDELRDVQLLALERRIRMSKCLVLFPVKKQDVDVMEHYFDQGYKKNDGTTTTTTTTDVQQQRHNRHVTNLEFDDLTLRPGFTSHSFHSSNCDDTNSVHSAGSNGNHRDGTTTVSPKGKTASGEGYSGGNRNDEEVGSPESRNESMVASPLSGASLEESPNDTRTSPTMVQSNGDDSPEETTNPDMITEFTTQVQQNVQENIDILQRVNLADGWDAGTTPEAMSDDLMLGLRDGFCGALSSFSSWNSSMIALLRGGRVGEAFVGYMLGLQLPIIAYRFGQHVAVYIFIWRTRRETRVDERRGGYGIRVAVDEDTDEQYDDARPSAHADDDETEEEEDEQPSVRAIVTAVFIMALVTQCTSISFFRDPDDQQIAMSLLFSPLGVLARWRLSKLNTRFPGFPIGTFIANLMACALSGSLGELLAGNPGPRERIVLVSFIAGFGGTLSSLATFVVEILAGVDPILFRFDGVIYAVTSIGCALIVGFIFSASVEWADETAPVPVEPMMNASDATDAMTNTSNVTLFW